MKAPPEPSLVPYNNIHQGILLMRGLNPWLSNTPDSLAGRERSGKRARGLLLGETITVLGIDPKGLIAPTSGEKLPQNAVLGRATHSPNGFKQRNEETRVSTAVYI